MNTDRSTGVSGGTCLRYDSPQCNTDHSSNTANTGMSISKTDSSNDSCTGTRTVGSVPGSQHILHIGKTESSSANPAHVTHVITFRTIKVLVPVAVLCVLVQ